MSFIISRMEEQKRNKERFNLFTEDGFLTSLSLDAVLHYGIKEGSEISEELMDTIKKEDTVKYAKEKAMEYVAYAPRSTFQVRQKLKQKGIDEKSIDETISALEYYHYVDDSEFVKEFTKSYKGRLGRRAIVQKLREKGVSPDVIEDSMEISEEEELSSAREQAQILISRNRGLEVQKLRQKIYQTLTRKGYPYDIVSTILSEVEDD